LALGSLLTISLQSHAAALGSPLAILLDWAHLSAMSAWLGGLLPLFLLLRSTSLPPGVLVPRFSRLALVCVAVLALTGMYSAIIHVGTLDALTQTTYGWALIVKVGFFGLLVLLGAINLLALSPRLSNESGSAARTLNITVRVELLVGLVVLLAAGFLASAAPSLEAIQARHRLGYIGEYQDKGVRFNLWVAPARAGYNEIAVDVTRLPRGVDPSQIQVQIRLLMLDQDMGITQVMASPSGQQRWEAKGSYLSMAGRWEMEVTVRRPGADDVVHIFLFPVQPQSDESSLHAPISD
jgi:copper transport protein